MERAVICVIGSIHWADQSSRRRVEPDLGAHATTEGNRATRERPHRARWESSIVLALQLGAFVALAAREVGPEPALEAADRHRRDSEG